MSKKTKKTTTPEEAPKTPEAPKLVRRRENKKSTFKLGRTIGAKREKLETANERAASRKKDKQKNFVRLVSTICIFAVLTVILGSLLSAFFDREAENADELFFGEDNNIDPTTEIIDEENANEITARMKLFIARVEKEFKMLGFETKQAVVPKGGIREVDFYLEGAPGFIKTTIDRNPAITAEDAERMIRYLSEKGITEYTYIDVRIEGKAFWK